MEIKIENSDLVLKIEIEKRECDQGRIGIENQD
jgi:hypothetical protein